MGGAPGAAGAAVSGAGSSAAAIPGFIKGLGATNPTQFGMGLAGQGLSQLGKMLPMMAGGTSKGPIMTNLPQINTMPNGTPNPQMAQGIQTPGMTPQRAVSPQFAGAAAQAPAAMGGQAQPGAQTRGLGGGAVAPVAQPSFNAQYAQQPVVNGFTQSQSIPGLPMAPIQAMGVNPQTQAMSQNLQMLQNPLYAQYLPQYRNS
jgi:hypothetical protein